MVDRPVGRCRVAPHGVSPHPDSATLVHPRQQLVTPPESTFPAVRMPVHSPPESRRPLIVERRGTAVRSQIGADVQAAHARPVGLGRATR